MDKTDFFEYCERVLAANGLSEYGRGNALDLYYLLAEELVEVNKHMNLTAITDMKGIILRHIADSLFCLSLQTEQERLPMSVAGRASPLFRVR